MPYVGSIATTLSVRGSQKREIQGLLPHHCHFPENMRSGEIFFTSTVLSLAPVASGPDSGCAAYCTDFHLHRENGCGSAIIFIACRRVRFQTPDIRSGRSSSKVLMDRKELIYGL